MADAYVLEATRIEVEAGSEVAYQFVGDAPHAIQWFEIKDNPNSCEIINFDKDTGECNFKAPQTPTEDRVIARVCDENGHSEWTEIPIMVFPSVAPPPIKLPPSARPAAEPSPAPVAPVAKPVAPTPVAPTPAPTAVVTPVTPAPARVTINCPGCAGSNPLGAVYCQQCGTLIAAKVAPVVETAAPEADTSPIKRMVKCENPSKGTTPPSVHPEETPAARRTAPSAAAKPSASVTEPDPATTSDTPAPEEKAEKKATTSVNCPKCSFSNAPGAVYCQKCGKPLATPDARRTAPSAAATKSLAKPKKEEGETPEKKEEDKKPKASDPVADKKDATAGKDKASWWCKVKGWFKKPPLALKWIIAILFVILMVAAWHYMPDAIKDKPAPTSSSGSAVASTSASAPVSASTPSSTTATTAPGALCPSGYISIPATKENVCRYLGYPASEVPDEISTSPGPGRLLVCREAPTGSGVADITGHECAVCWPEKVKLGEKTPATVAAPLLWNQQANHMKPPSWASPIGQPPRYPNCGEVQMLDCEVALNPDGSENNSACNVLAPALAK